MADEKEAEGLSPSEQAFFESGGQTEVTPETPAPVETPVEGAEGAPPEANAPRDEKGKFVPHQALHAEREEHKKTRAEVQELKEFKARMDERWRLIEAAAANQPPEQQADPDPEPDPNVDIFKHNAWLSRQLARERQTTAERQQHEEQTRQAAEGEKRVWEYWHETARAESAANPEFADAVTFMSGVRTKQLKSLAGVHKAFKSEAGIAQQIDAELRDLVIASAQNGLSPAKVVFEMAKEWGYQGKAPPPPDPLVLPDALKRVEQAQSQSRTIATAPGRAGGDEMTPEALLALPEPEFAAWMNVPANARKYKAWMGG
jgi:hypothetical protein